MNALLDAALRLQNFCQDNQWDFCFIGGIAVQRWGEPRFTQDADMTLLTGYCTQGICWPSSRLDGYRICFIASTR